MYDIHEWFYYREILFYKQLVSSLVGFCFNDLFNQCKTVFGKCGIMLDNCGIQWIILRKSRIILGYFGSMFDNGI